MWIQMSLSITLVVSPVTNKEIINPLYKNRPELCINSYLLTHSDSKLRAFLVEVNWNIHHQGIYDAWPRASCTFPFEYMRMWCVAMNCHSGMLLPRHYAVDNATTTKEKHISDCIAECACLPLNTTPADVTVWLILHVCVVFSESRVKTVDMVTRST